jgi:hypothetical protein
MDMSGADWYQANLPADVYNPRADYGDCLTDVRHSLTWSLTYALPQKAGYGQMLEGWKLNSIVRYQTALPWNAADTKDNISGTSELEDHWDFFGNPSDFSDLKYAGVPYYLPGTPPPTDLLGPTDPAYAKNHSACTTQAATLDGSYTPLYSTWTTGSSGYGAALLAFGCYANGNSVLLPPAYGTYGNNGRNIFRGEPFRIWDISIMKDVRFTERLKGEFRFEVFNVLNQVNYYTNTGSPSSTTAFGSSRQSPDVGISNATVGSGGPRSIQLGLRLQF